MFKSSFSRILSMIAVPVIIFLMALAFLNSARATQGVLIVARPLQPGSRLDESAVVIRDIPKAAILPGAFTEPAQVVNQTVTIGRLPGDQITAEMVGPAALSAIAASLAPDYRAVAVRIDRASGLAGMLQNGDRVTVVGIIDPQSLQFQLPTGMMAFGEEKKKEETVPSPVAMVVVPSLRVLLVPQSFRYQEAMPGEEDEYMPAFSSTTAQEAGVVLLEVPIAPQPIAPEGLEMSPAELLPLLDRYGHIHLLLDPLEADYSIPPTGADLVGVYRTMMQQAAITATLPGLEVAP